MTAGPEAMEAFFTKDGAPAIDALVSLTGFSLVGGPAYNDARAAEAGAMAQRGITQVQASAGYSARRVHLAATNGFSGSYGRTSRSISAVAFTGEGTGMERDYAGEGRVFQTDLPDATAIGVLAGERALARAGADVVVNYVSRPEAAEEVVAAHGAAL